MGPSRGLFVPSSLVHTFVHVCVFVCGDMLSQHWKFSHAEPQENKENCINTPHHTHTHTHSSTTHSWWSSFPTWDGLKLEKVCQKTNSLQQLQIREQKGFQGCSGGLNVLQSAEVHLVGTKEGLFFQQQLLSTAFKSFIFFFSVYVQPWMYIWHTLTCALTITIQKFVVGEIVFNYYLCVYSMCGLVNLTLWGQNGPTKIAISMTWSLGSGDIFGLYEETFSVMGRVWGCNIQFVQYKNHYVYGKFP